MKQWYNTLTPYKVLPHNGIQYTTCRDFNHISRYRGLRQVIHSPKILDDRFIALETCNAFSTRADMDYYEVPIHEENRLDAIAYKKLGSSTYGWVLAYVNNIEDGYTVHEGQVLAIPKSIYDFFEDGELLQSVSPYTLNLGSE